MPKKNDDRYEDESRLLVRVVEVPDGPRVVEVGRESGGVDGGVEHVAWTTVEGAVRLAAQLMLAFDDLCFSDDDDLFGAIRRIMEGSCVCNKCMHTRKMAELLVGQMAKYELLRRDQLGADEAHEEDEEWLH